MKGSGKLCKGALLLCLSACLDGPPPPVRPAPIEVLGLSPEQGVPLMMPVRLQLSGAVFSIGTWPIEVWSERAEVPIAIAAGVDNAELVMTPELGWPSGALLEVRLSEGVVDETGEPIRLPDHNPTFQTVSAELPQSEVTVRAPGPGRPAPLNLRYFSIAVAPPIEPPEKVFLITDTQQITTSVVAGEGSVLLVEVPTHQEPCRPLCPDTTYRVQLAGGFTAAGPRGEIHTATVTDRIAPTITATVVLQEGDRLVLRVDTSEPVILSGDAHAPNGSSVPLVAPLVASKSSFLEPAEQLLFDERYRLEIAGEDLAGNPLPSVTVEANTLPEIIVKIRELVPTPLHDWGDSDGEGIPFDPYPGSGTVSIADEWIELVNYSRVPIDLARSGLRLQTIDGSPAITDIDGALGLYFGDGGERHAWWPGEALVVRPRGSMSQQDVVVEIWSGSRLLDRVTLAADGDHAGGRPPNLFHESLAFDMLGRLRWCVPTPGDPMPAVDCF